MRHCSTDVMDQGHDLKEITVTPSYLSVQVQNITIPSWTSLSDSCSYLTMHGIAAAAAAAAAAAVVVVVVVVVV
jgi:hypothetical protein